MRRQTAHSEATGLEPGYRIFLNPGSMPHNFTQQMQGCDQPAQVYLDRDTVIIKRRANGLPLTLVVPVHMFEGIVVTVLPGDVPGTVLASLTLKHKDPAISLVLAETVQPEAFSTLWPEWSKLLALPMLVCDINGDIKPIEAYSARPAATPTPRRKLAMLTGRRPRFLVKREIGKHREGYPVIHRHEREIIARN